MDPKNILFPVSSVLLPRIKFLISSINEFPGILISLSDPTYSFMFEYSVKEVLTYPPNSFNSL